MKKSQREVTVPVPQQQNAETPSPLTPAVNLNDVQMSGDALVAGDPFTHLDDAGNYLYFVKCPL